MLPTPLGIVRDLLWFPSSVELYIVVDVVVYLVVVCLIVELLHKVGFVSFFDGLFKSVTSLLSMVRYFLLQEVCSLLFLVSLNVDSLFIGCVLVSLKRGLPPCHLWLVRLLSPLAVKRVWFMS